MASVMVHLELLPLAVHWRLPNSDMRLLHAKGHSLTPGASHRGSQFGRHIPLFPGARPKIASCSAEPSSDAAVIATTGNPGFDHKGRKTLAHPDYAPIQDMWHPTLNQGKQPVDLPHKSRQKVWLRCPGCVHGCGRQHEWEGRAFSLTQRGGLLNCPYCVSRGRLGRFCYCHSVAADPVLSREWHPDNPPADQVARSSGRRKYLWVCLRGHEPYEAACDDRFGLNAGCPQCYTQRRGSIHHPTLSEGRPDLAKEWDSKKNDKSPSDVTLGSNYGAWWVCSKDASHPRWQTRVFNRALQGKGCSACGQMKRGNARTFGTP